MAWRRSGNKPLSEPMMVSLLMHTCITRPQWSKHISDKLLHLAFYLARQPCLFFSRSVDGGDLYGHNSHLCLPLRSYNVRMCYLSMHTRKWGHKVNQLTWLLELQYCQVSNIRCTKSQHLKDSRTILWLSLPNPLKPDVKSRMKI